MRICYLPSDFDGPGCYRCLFPGRQLQRLGHEVVIPPNKQHDVGGGRVLIEFAMDTDPPFPDADVFVLQARKENHWPSTIGRMRSLYGKTVIAEVDDDYVGLPAYNAGFHGTRPYDTTWSLDERGRMVRRRERRELTRDNLFKTLAAADAVSVSTPALKERYERFNGDVVVVRNYLDWDMWADVEQQSEVEREKVRVGWMGRIEWRAGDLQVLRGIIGPFLERNPHVEFVSAGSPEVHDLLGVPVGQRVDVAPVNFRDMQLASITAVMDVGLVPLEMNQFNEGKSHLKGMEYAACGIPCIASPTESYRDYWLKGKEGEIGFLARKPKEWIRHLELLVNDDELRREMGRRARAEAARHTIQEHAVEWERFYEERLKPPTDRAYCLARASVGLGAIQKPAELEQLIRLVGSPRVVLEIGTAKGGTFYAWCRQARPDALIISLDLPGGEFGGGHSLQHQELLRQYAKPDQEVHFVRADSHDPATLEQIKEILAGREVDFLMIDGDHTYEGVKRDYEMYAPLVKEGGLVAFHDIVEHPDFPTCKVDEFWAEIKESGVPCGEIVDGGRWGGIGVVANRARVAA